VGGVNDDMPLAVCQGRDNTVFQSGIVDARQASASSVFVVPHPLLKLSGETRGGLRSMALKTLLRHIGWGRSIGQWWQGCRMQHLGLFSRLEIFLVTGGAVKNKEVSKIVHVP
jgi:hypothetical protein